MKVAKLIMKWLWRLALGWLGLSIGVVLLLRWVNPPTTAFILARQMDSDDIVIEQRWVELENISAHLPLSVIASEDQKFLEHYGFDVESIQDALEDRQNGKRIRGASTITQQTAKNLFLWSGKSYFRKALEAYFTLLIELLWDKHRIMEVYLNVAEFGDGVYGAEAGSRRFFGYSASRLNHSQAALMATVLPSPKRMDVAAPSAYMRERQQWVVRQGQQLGGTAVVATLVTGE